ncbi:MAG: eukaryotic-like serine/threonine-protein kinase [Candidatus Sumerlaeota bacterium]|nr:eukaryotic-like serine/threonine-protein kinase [Candidatus Sumerlaeota bacterium]
MAGLDSLQHIGPFQVLECLGFNGAAATYKAMNTAGRKGACVVALDATEVASMDAFRAVQSEFTVLRGSAGQRVLRPLECGEGDGFYWAAYDFLTGRHIGNTVQEIGLPPVGSSFAVAAQVVEALVEMQQMGLAYHGLITPASIFLTETQQIRLLHAGWSRILLGVHGAVAHPCFMSNLPFVAPELAEGKEGEIATDVFSLGANLFFLLCGQPVHWADDPNELAEMMASRPVDLAPLQDLIGGEGLELLEEMLELDPMDRPVNLEALHQRLDALAAELPSLPIDPGPSSVTIQKIMSGSGHDESNPSTEIEQRALGGPGSFQPEPIPSSTGFVPPPPPPPPQKANAAPPPHQAVKDIPEPPAPESAAQTGSTGSTPSGPAGIPEEYRKSVESSGASPGKLVLIAVAVLLLLGGIGTAMYFVLDAFVFSKAADVAATTPKPDGKPPAAAETPGDGKTETPASGGKTASTVPAANRYEVTAERLEELAKFHRKYIAEFGIWPLKLDQLKELGAEDDVLKDAWDRDFDLRSEFIISRGADNKWDTPDDIWFDAKELELGGKTR